MSKFGSALSISLALHGVLAVFLLISVDFHSLPKPVSLQSPDFAPIQAVVVDAKTINEQLNKIEQAKEAQRQKELKKIRDEQRRKDEAAKRIRDEADKKRRQIEDKKRREQAAIAAKEKQRKEQQQAEQQEQERQARELERKAAEERERKAREKQEAEERAKQLAQRKKQEEQERKELERLMQEQLEAEQAQQAVRNQQRQRFVLTEVQKYQAWIEAKIVQNWNYDDSMKGKTCRIQIRLSTTGFVISVQTLGGDKRVCLTGEQAVRRAGELPMSSDPEVYNELKDITFNFGF
ncbi:cell envelope integrity protein TolA [Aliiglaciecola sp. LCG003]|uniref:cell envelope integrity protein TolA n=1 Tax=Aliiglaciecola sp. LCG003 TaxID=3053655 RepID=UPI0025729CF1|nr:cell envelope integrity protein TolA [Aliiglaciecola sp. LCG003]WJG08107.1 cell envelope integrity protein TolA [Aliiglaciecola sp. LCG003]